MIDKSLIMGNIFLISGFIFFSVQFSNCQKIYNSGKIKRYMFYAFGVPVLLTLFFRFKNSFELLPTINISLLTFYFLMLLYILQQNYKKLNEELIKRKAVDGIFSGKDFTYVFWDSDINTSWWDEGAASKPSWLDELISFLLLIIPLIIVGLIHLLITAFS